ncbi:MAG TPA: low molecular weight phosphatase family protein [Candidatus Aminicenantes bacterium]|nr:low molecular weight phosphatase family protein [Candidatus Aminicenantes bacterium]HRY65006.1 low molecular weight phosphatase family protein [Candidatus Aminicenantes bacterium]HRZ71919.1 low molecular weight phosphatase family protein [Candidatus Aminicenantes bacterium]
MTAEAKTARAAKRLLFVCYGNICRSPMAEGIARRRLGAAVEVASAGIGATGGPASEEAVLVMKHVYKTDISSHVARPVGAYDLGTFDYIVALDPSIYHQLRDYWQVPEEVLYGWDIEDPLGSGYQAYREAALAIERRLGQFLAAVGLEP